MESLSSEAKCIASIPWKNVKGLRDIIVHHYFDVDAAQILWIVKNELSPLKEAILFFIDLWSKRWEDRYYRDVSRNWNSPIYLMPLSSVYSAMSVPTMTIFLKLSLIFKSEFNSCWRFSSESNANADWM